MRYDSLVKQPIVLEREPTTAELEALLRKRLERTEWRRVLFALLLIGLAAFMLWLWYADPSAGGADPPLTAYIALFALCAWFILAGVRLLYRALKSGARRAWLLDLLEHHPQRIARIYAAVMRSRPGVHRQVIPAPEDVNLPLAPGGFHILIELKEPSRLQRLLGRHKHAVTAPRDELVPLLGYLRSLAPDAQGPPI
jgi:hypothetical protein